MDLRPRTARRLPPGSFQPQRASPRPGAKIARSWSERAPPCESRPRSKQSSIFFMGSPFNVTEFRTRELQKGGPSLLSLSIFSGVSTSRFTSLPGCRLKSFCSPPIRFQEAGYLLLSCTVASFGTWTTRFNRTRPLNHLSKGDSSIPRKASAFSPYSTGA